VEFRRIPFIERAHLHRFNQQASCKEDASLD
jgi:hypothetical protein